MRFCKQLSEHLGREAICQHMTVTVHDPALSCARGGMPNSRGLGDQLRGELILDLGDRLGNGPSISPSPTHGAQAADAFWVCVTAISTVSVLLISLHASHRNRFDSLRLVGRLGRD
jgi:hypothetical protein